MILPGADLVDILELIGVFAFALSGALAAAERRLDVAGLCALALSAGLAGGTLRDLLDGASVFWLDRPLYLAAPLVAAGAVWALGERAWRDRALVWCDAAGLAAVAAVATGRAAATGATPLAAAGVGLLAAMAGGAVRDALARRSPLMLGRELYLAAAGSGVLLTVALQFVEVGAALSVAAGAALAFGLRAGAIRRGWALPGPPEQD